MRFFIVDAFTDTAFQGNPAGVVLLEEPADSAWMQSVAAELGYSETAFVETTDDEKPKSLRWFTPTVEVNLCGHATLATGHVLGGDQIFQTRSGELRTRTTGDGWITMDFPVDPPTKVVDEIPGAAAALAGLAVEEVVRGREFLLAVTPDAAGVRAWQPDLEAITRVDALGVIVSAAGDKPGIDFVSRVFVPAAGIPEDPVTGAAHCLLAPYWSRRLGREELTGAQLSARGGVVRTRLDGERVVLAGQAVTVAEGKLLV